MNIELVNVKELNTKEKAIVADSEYRRFKFPDKSLTENGNGTHDMPVRKRTDVSTSSPFSLSLGLGGGSSGVKRFRESGGGLELEADLGSDSGTERDCSDPPKDGDESRYVL